MKFLLSLICACCLATGAHAAQSAAKAQKELEELGVLLGYATACVEKATGASDPEGRDFGQQLGIKYRELGSEMVSILSNATRIGVTAMGMENGKNCASVLKQMTKSYKSMGLTGALYQSALNQMEGSKPQKNSRFQAETLPPGLYVGGKGKAALHILLSPDGAGQALDDEATRIAWKKSGKNLTLDFLDQKGRRAQSLKAAITSPTTFNLNGLEYSLMPESEARIYEYAGETREGGMTLQLINPKNKDEKVAIETQGKSGGKCSFSGLCKNRNGILICRPEDRRVNPDLMVIITRSQSDARRRVDSTYPAGDFCASNGSFTGVYRQIQP